MLPIPGGIDALAMARTAAVRVPFLLITVFGDDRLRELARGVRARGLDKPFLARELKVEVRQLLEPLCDTRSVPESLRVWSVDEAIQVMDEQMLRVDMFPTLNEVDGTWDVCLSDERGNGIEYISFETEAAADAFCEALGEEIERRSDS